MLAGRSLALTTWQHFPRQPANVRLVAGTADTFSPSNHKASTISVETRVVLHPSCNGHQLSHSIFPVPKIRIAYSQDSSRFSQRNNRTTLVHEIPVRIHPRPFSRPSHSSPARIPFLLGNMLFYRPIVMECRQTEILPLLRCCCVDCRDSSSMLFVRPKRKVWELVGWGRREGWSRSNSEALRCRDGSCASVSAWRCTCSLFSVSI